MDESVTLEELLDVSTATESPAELVDNPSDGMIVDGYPTSLTDLDSGWYFWGIKSPEDCVLEGEAELPRGSAAGLLKDMKKALERLREPQEADQGEGGRANRLQAFVARRLSEMESRAKSAPESISGQSSNASPDSSRPELVAEED